LKSSGLHKKKKAEEAFRKADTDGDKLVSEKEF